MACGRRERNAALAAVCAQASALGLRKATRSRLHAAALRARNAGVGNAAAMTLIACSLRTRSRSTSATLASTAVVASDGAGMLASAVLDSLGESAGSMRALAACARRSRSSSKQLLASKRFALRLFQHGNDEDAVEVLRSLKHFRAIINPALLRAEPMPHVELQDAKALNNALPEHLAARLASHLRPGSAFWQEHSYSTGVVKEGRDEGYFSYSASTDAMPDGILGQALNAVQTCAERVFPEHMSRASFCELWAHSRLLDGHQLHFDTQDEGRGTSRNPLVSAVLYLSNAGSGTLVASHCHGEAPHPDDVAAAICRPFFNRILLFAGEKLHGVLPAFPGSVPRHERRLTVMVAFWDEGFGGPKRSREIGSARCFPTPEESDEKWVHQLLSTREATGHSYPSEAKLTPLEGTAPLWKSVDPQRPLSNLPHYNATFQGC